MTVSTEFNNYIQRIEDFTITIPFFKLKIGFSDKTTRFYRIMAILGCGVFLVLWIMTGYETTIMRLFTKELPTGVGIHWGTIIFTLGSFIVCSFVLERNGVKKLRNALYSVILATGFINGIFECTYALLYDFIHHGQ